jgi:hypothetical protein
MHGSSFLPLAGNQGVEEEGVGEGRRWKELIGTACAVCITDGTILTQKKRGCGGPEWVCRDSTG